MAKTNGKTKVGIGVVFTLLLAFSGIAGTWAVYGEDISRNEQTITKMSDTVIPRMWENMDKKATKESVHELKEDGCDPSRVNKFDIGMVQKDIDSIQRSQEKMEVQQREGFKEILERLPK